jgi:hypothetical protein
MPKRSKSHVAPAHVGGITSETASSGVTMSRDFLRLPSSSRQSGSSVFLSANKLLSKFKLASLLLLGAACGCAMAAVASAEPAWVKADAGLSGIRISASMGVDADADTVWSTLTDYDRLTEFVPSMTVSRVVSKPGRPKRVEQKAESGVFSFVMPDHVVLAMEEVPPNQIRFKAISGSVVAMSGEWRILGKNRPVRLVYRSHVVPMVPPPPLVSDSFIEDEVRKRFEAVGKEAERRMREANAQPAEAGGAAPSPQANPASAPASGKPNTYMQEYVPNKYLPR